MKRIKLQLYHLNIIQIAIILLIIGLFSGVVFANIFRDTYNQQLLQYQNTIFSEITSSDINYSGLFTFVLGKNFKEFIVFWLLAITILGIPYMAYKITSFGFYTGFFISAVTMQYGAKGILLVLAYEFPHGLIYLPIALLSLYKGYMLCRTINYDKRNSVMSISKLLKANLIILILLAAALLLGSFLETYIGAFLLKKTLGLFT